MNPRMLWCTELPPVLDVTRGPINGAARQVEQSPGEVAPITGTAGSNPAAAPPEPTPADSEGAARTTTASNEAPGTEREGAAWVPWEGGECPVPGLTMVRVRWHGGIDSVDGPFDAQNVVGWSEDVRAYRLANPTPRGPCTLPPDHPHAELARLYMSDDTLRAWWLNPAYLKWVEAIAPFVWASNVRYHVGHVPPKEAA